MKTSTIKALAEFSKQVDIAIAFLSAGLTANLTKVNEADQALQSALKDELQDPYFEPPIKS